MGSGSVASWKGASEGAAARGSTQLVLGHDRAGPHRLNHVLLPESTHHGSFGPHHKSRTPSRSSWPLMPDSLASWRTQPVAQSLVEFGARGLTRLSGVRLADCAATHTIRTSTASGVCRVPSDMGSVMQGGRAQRRTPPLEAWIVNCSATARVAPLPLPFVAAFPVCQTPPTLGKEG